MVYPREEPVCLKFPLLKWKILSENETESEYNQMTPIVDAHQHFWKYGTYQTSWMEEPPYSGDPKFAAIRKSFGPADLYPQLIASGVSAAITVEAADGYEENGILLANAAENPWIAGVVGWIPLVEPESAGKTLDLLSREPKFVGVRHLINIEPDPDWIISERVIEGLKLLATYGLTFDYVGILPRHLQHVPTLAELVPSLRIVIDHLAKPPIFSGEFEPWASQIAAAAEAPNVYAKLSGFDAGFGDQWSAANLARYVDHALNIFGPSRIIYGSDWPVSVLQGGYEKVWHEVTAVLSSLSEPERARILGGTAIEVYGLKIGQRIDFTSR